MDRLTRLLQIAITLQSRQVITAKELSEKFEISIRTVYRDIRALEQAGIPVYAEAGVGYSVADGYSLPPLNFSEREMNALITAGKMIGKNPDESLHTYYQSALEKIRALSRLKGEADKVEQTVSPSLPEPNFTSSYLSEIQLAITHRRLLFLYYSSAGKGEETERIVEPLAVYFTTSSWIMIGWCRLRNAIREFRTDRMIRLNVLDDQFDSRAFDMEKYFRRQSQW